MRNVKENIEMGDKKSNTKGVSPHLIVADERDDWDTWDQRFKALLG